MKHPIIGVKRTVVKHTKRKDVTTVYSAELRGWELAALGLIGLAAWELGAVQGALEGVLPSKPTITTGSGAVISNPIANIPIVGSVFGQLVQMGSKKP